MSRQIAEGRGKTDDGRRDVDEREPPLRARARRCHRGHEAEDRVEEVGQGRRVRPRQVDHAAENREHREDDERHRHGPRRLVRVVLARDLAEALLAPEGSTNRRVM